MFCYYGEVNDSNENNQENCTNSGHKWSNSLNKCFLDMDQNYITECPADYEYYDSSNYWELFEVQNNGSGCYKKIAKENGCPSDDFVLTANSCVHTMDATVINLFKIAKDCLLSLASIHAFLVSHASQHIEHSRYSANICDGHQ